MTTGTTGGAGTGTDPCEQLKTAVAECYDMSCVGNSSAFCGCWRQGMDIDATCSCVPLNMDVVCEVVDLEGWDGLYDCGAAMEYVETLCD